MGQWKDFHGIAASGFSHAVRSKNDVPRETTLSLEEQLFKCGTPFEKEMIRRKRLERIALAEKARLQEFEPEPDINAFA